MNLLPSEIIMAKAHVDPEDLRRFARDLTRFNQDLETLLNSLHARLRALESSWKDQEQQRFSAEFLQTTKSLGRFLEASRLYAASLQKKAGHIEEYLRQR